VKRSWIKKVCDCTAHYFSDFKHHPESWKKSKKLRARHERRKLKEMLKKEDEE
jgi:hypothetical protein